MNWELVWKLLKVDEELGTVEVLREHTSFEQFYLVDWRALLVADILRMVDIEAAHPPDLFSNDED